MKRRVLLVGDGVVATGFSKMNHAYADGLIRAGWDVHMLAINYHGDPHKYPFPIYPCRSVNGGDGMGMRRTAELTTRLRPDVVCVTQDPWNVPPYLKAAGNVPVVLSVAVDGRNCKGSFLNGAAHSVFWTEFGMREAKEGGYQGRASVIPLGVDLADFFPVDRDEARRAVGLPASLKGAFIVGAVGRNQPRKRLDLTMVYFAEWVKRFGHDDAYLFMHVAPTGDAGYDLLQLGKWLGISNRVIMSEPPIEHGMPIESLRNVYSSFDAMLTTTQGEGWGLCQMEAMACGVPVIVPDWSALAEWPGPAAYKVRCTSFACTPNGINVVGGIMDQREALQALDLFYRSEKPRLQYREAGLALVARDEFRWPAIGDAFAAAVGSVMAPKLQRVEVTAHDEAEPSYLERLG